MNTFATNSAAPGNVSADRHVHIGLSAETCDHTVVALNDALAHLQALRDLYKQAHWQASGMHFHALHNLYEEHHSELLELVDLLGERVHTLGGVAVALARDVAAGAPAIAESPARSGDAAAQLQRLLDSHELVIDRLRHAAQVAADYGDEGSNDLLVGAALRTQEKQSWVVAQHLPPACPYCSYAGGHIAPACV